jgi:hypothetical protein
MAPKIEVSYKVLKDLKNSGRPVNQEPLYGFKKGFTYVPFIKLYVEEESHLVENWYKAHDSSEKKLRMLKIPEFIIFFKHVEDYDEKIYRNLTRGKQWRIELLDAYFIQKKDGLYVSTEHRTNTEKLKSALMEDREISLDSLLKNSTSQGLPRPDIERPNTNEDKLNYSPPENNGVAGLEIINGTIHLHFDLNPSSTQDVLRVRRCFSLESEKNLESVIK